MEKRGVNFSKYMHCHVDMRNAAEYALGRIYYPMTPSKEVISPGLRLLYGALRSAHHDRSLKLDDQLRNTRSIADAASQGQLSAVKEEHVNAVRQQILHSNQVRAYCTNILNQDSVNRKKLNVDNSPSDAMAALDDSLKPSNDVSIALFNHSMLVALNIPQRIIRDVARGRARAKDYRDRLFDQSQSMILRKMYNDDNIVTLSDSKLIRAIMILDQLEHPHLYSMKQDKQLSLTALARAPKMNLIDIECVAPPRVFSYDKSSSTRWIQFQIRGEKRKKIVMYWKQGTCQVIRDAPSKQMKRGFRRSLREAEKAANIKPASDEIIVSFWNDLQGIKRGVPLPDVDTVEDKKLRSKQPKLTSTEDSNIHTTEASTESDTKLPKVMSKEESKEFDDQIRKRLRSQTVEGSCEYRCVLGRPKIREINMTTQSN